MGWISKGLSTLVSSFKKGGSSIEVIKDGAKIAGGMAVAGFIEGQFEFGGRITAKAFQEFCNSNGWKIDDTTVGGIWLDSTFSNVGSRFHMGITMASMQYMNRIVDPIEQQTQDIINKRNQAYAQKIENKAKDLLAKGKMENNMIQDALLVEQLKNSKMSAKTSIVVGASTLGGQYSQSVGTLTTGKATINNGDKMSNRNNLDNSEMELLVNKLINTAGLR